MGFWDGFLGWVLTVDDLGIEGFLQWIRYIVP